MALQDFSYFSKKAQDWRATSYGDVGVCAGYGGGLKHLKLWSPSQNLKVNSLVLHVSTGAEVEVNSAILTFINSTVQYLVKGKDAATSESNYKTLKCVRSFSIADYIGSTCAGGETSLALGIGDKVGGLVVLNSTVGGLFSIPPEVETCWGIGGGVTAFRGIVLGIGVQFYDYNMQQRFLMELNRKPTDPVIRDAAHY